MLYENIFFSKLLLIPSLKDNWTKIIFKNDYYSGVVFQALRIYAYARIVTYFYSGAAAWFLLLMGICINNASSVLT